MRALSLCKTLHYTHPPNDVLETGVAQGSEEERINKTIHATRQFFESMGVKTHLSDYQLDGNSIPAMIKKLEQ